MPQEKQSERFCMRLTPLAAALIDDLTEWMQLSRADVVRQALRALHAEERLRGHRKGKK